MGFFGCIMTEFDRTTDIDAARMLFLPSMRLSSEKRAPRSKPRFSHLPITRHTSFVTSLQVKAKQSATFLFVTIYWRLSGVDLFGTSLALLIIQIRQKGGENSENQNISFRRLAFS
jgi:hypothetical protein